MRLVKSLAAISILLFLTSCKETIVEKTSSAGENFVEKPTSCTVLRKKGDDFSTILCPDGTTSIVKDGSNGINGQDGRDGIDGQDGENCTVQTLENGSLITCGETTSFVSNGQDGRDGINGTNGQDGRDAILPNSAITEVISICPNTPHSEVLLRTSDGSILGAFTNSQNNTYLAYLKNDNSTIYQTSNSTPCRFKINEDWDVIELTGSGKIHKRNKD